MTVFCAPPALIALNDSEGWFENAVALSDLIENGLIIAVYEPHDRFAGFIDNTTADGRWKIGGRNVAVYSKTALSVRNRIAAARALAARER
jgi:hypothetical protein